MGRLDVTVFYTDENHCSHPRLTFHGLFRAPGIGVQTLSLTSGALWGLIPMGRQEEEAQADFKSVSTPSP